jgi:chromosome segregation ATPase
MYGLVFLAAEGADLTPIFAAIIAAGATAIVALLTLGPTRKNISAQATKAAVETIDAVRKALEERLEETQRELTDYRDQLATAERRIWKLEHELELRDERTAAVKAELEARLEVALRERDAMRRRVTDMEAELGDLRSRLPERRQPKS